MEKISNGGLSDNTGFLTGSQLSSTGSLLNIATSILQAYGGSLWIASPYYSYVMSEGTGDTTDNSDVGYVRDLCATYGAELITNGDFSQGSTGWTVFQPTAGAVTFDGTKATVNSTDGSIAGLLKTSLLVVGKVYELSFDVVVRSGQCIVGDNNTVTYALANATGKFKAVFTATSTALQVKRGAGGLPNDFDIDNISVREIIGRPLFQATTGFKPKLKRVPKRLGPELVGTSWAGIYGGTPSLSSGTLTVTSDGSSAFAGASQAVSLQTGKQYFATYDVVDASQSAGVYLMVGSTFQTSPPRSLLFGPHTSVGTYGTAFTAVSGAAGYMSVSAGNGGMAAGETITFKNISVREVLEWGWAWVFDGTDDVLATVSLPAATDETVMVCATSLTSAGVARAPIGKRSLNNGLFIRREAGGSLNGTTMTGSGFGSMTLESPHTNFQPFVATVAAKSGATRGRLNGTQKATTAAVYAGWEGQLGVGSEKGAGAGTLWSGYVFAAAYIPGSPPDAELLIVERAMAQLAGVTTQ